MKRSKRGCWRGDYKGKVIRRVNKYLLVRDTEVTILKGFQVLKLDSLSHADVNFVGDPDFWAGIWTALREE